MALDDKAVERMLKAQREALQPSRNTPGADNSHLFEEFQRPPQPGEAPKPKGLNAQGYRFPPTQGEPPMTKENLAKGIGLPPSGNAVPPLPPPTELVAADPLFEEYQRPDLKHKPRTGQGLRHAVIPKTAKEILQGYEPPTPQVFTAKREPGAPAPAVSALPMPMQVNAPPSGLAAATKPTPPPPTPPPANTPTPAPASPPAVPVPDAAASQQEVAAHLDAEADLASAPELTMSHSRAHGPTRTITDHDPLHDMPDLPGKGKPARAAPATATGSAATAPGATTGAPHTNDAPAVEPGDGPRIALVQADFNYAITTRMAQVARETAEALGSAIALHVHVAGVFDVPLVAKALAARGDVDAVVAIGCVIQGETGHDEVIARECARKLADLTYDSGKPVGLAVTGPRMTRAAAEARAATVPRHAVEAVVKQWRTLKAVGASRLAAR